ncbi:MAG TPA: hypothetical protein VHV78_15615, partial [Gemmatimonadaceae bacterium]|nr:hypothetical protein [Gemmatimonadaceae bacterium]
EGFATGSLLVAALPPVVRTYPANKLPITAAAIDVGFFGAVTIGPLAGALVGEGSRWRLLHTAMAAFSALVLVVAWLSLPDKEAQNKDMAFDWPAITLAFAATMLPFAATALLDSRGFGSPLVIVGLVAGLGCLVTLLMTEYAKDDPLSPVKPMWNTLPVVGVIVAMVGGGVYVAVVRLIEQFGLDVSHLSPAATGAAFWPTVLATIVASVIVGVAVKSRALAVVTAIGMITLIAGTALFLSLPRVDGVRAGIANGLLGFGAGTTVSPGLWLAAFTLPSKMVGRTLALIELVRSEADFIIAPVVLHLARSSTQVTPSGLHVALTICLSVAAVGTVAAAGLYVAGLRTLETPALAKWLDGNDGALQSTPLLARLRGIAAVSRQAPVG